MSGSVQEIARLTAENAALRAEVEQLRRDAMPIITFSPDLKIGGGQARMLRALLARSPQMMTWEALARAADIQNAGSLRTFAARLRAAIRPHGFDVTNHTAVGLSLSESAAAKARALVVG